MPLYLSEADVAALLSPADALAAVEESFLRIARGAVENPPRSRVVMEDGVFAVMPCVDTELGYAGHKSYAWLAPRGTPFVVVLFSLGEARVEAVLEAETLSELRTAAASAVAVKHLARAEASTLGVVGCGRQAAAHVTALRGVLPALERVVAYCRNAERLTELCHAHDCEPAESHQDVAELDVVVTATTSHDPVVRGEWLREGALVCGVGANDPLARELDNVVLERATFVCCDSREQSKQEAGDLIEPVARGVLDWLEVHELHAVVAGEIEGRHAETDIVLFKSNGLAAWDLAAAAHVVRLARERGAGTEI